jgi:small subunit ribosomal protein S8e
MSIYQGRSKRKPSGGRYKSDEPKRIHRQGSSPAFTTVGDKKITRRRQRGGDTNKALLQANTITVHKPNDDEHVEADIDEVINSPANQNYVRRNIITKGCTVATSEGNVEVTSRPGQDGVLHGKIVDE